MRAGQAHQQFMSNGELRDFFIGDGTGMGKGREIAGIIQDISAMVENPSAKALGQARLASGAAAPRRDGDQLCIEFFTVLIIPAYILTHLHCKSFVSVYL